MSVLYYATEDSITNFLMHHGIKGQRWGIRRFQNKDGSLTPRGEKRYSDGNTKGAVKRAGKAIDAAFTPSIKRGKDKSPESPAEKITRETGNALNEAAKISDRRSKSRQTSESYKEAKTMSDEDILKAINRLTLEKRYMDLSSSVRDTGKTTVNDVLATAASVAGIAVSAVTVATAINGLRKKP